MNIFDSAKRILEEANYDTYLSSVKNEEFTFENSTILGFCRIYDSVDRLINNWDNDQLDFIQKNALRIRQSSEKAWNIYALLLTKQEPTDQQSKELLLIEENFSNTRKIARGGVDTDITLIYALLPLLPIQNEIFLSGERSVEELKKRIDLNKDAFDALINKNDSEDKIIFAVINELVESK